MTATGDGVSSDVNCKRPEAAPGSVRSEANETTGKPSSVDTFGRRTPLDDPTGAGRKTLDFVVPDRDDDPDTSLYASPRGWSAAWTLATNDSIVAWDAREVSSLNNWCRFARA